jgi:hypothetical protein
MHTNGLVSLDAFDVARFKHESDKLNTFLVSADNLVHAQISISKGHKTMTTMTMYFFTVEYHDGQVSRIQSCVPFEKWQKEPAFKGRLKAKMIKDDGTRDVECIDVP